jgi:hypothetical protein
MSGRSQYVFGYGSLTSRPGTPPTRQIDPSGFVADLDGMCRTWGVAMDNRRDLPGYKYYTGPDGARPDVYVAFLDLRPADGAAVNGVCLPVDDTLLAALDRRERNYERVDVSDRVSAVGARVWAYLGTAPARDRLRAGRAAGTAVIDAGYLRTVRAGFAALGAAEHHACLGSLAADGLEVVELTRHELP